MAETVLIPVAWFDEAAGLEAAGGKDKGYAFFALPETHMDDEGEDVVLEGFYVRIPADALGEEADGCIECAFDDDEVTLVKPKTVREKDAVTGIIAEKKGFDRARIETQAFLEAISDPEDEPIVQEPGEPFGDLDENPIYSVEDFDEGEGADDASMPEPESEQKPVEEPEPAEESEKMEQGFAEDAAELPVSEPDSEMGSFWQAAIDGTGPAPRGAEDLVEFLRENADTAPAPEPELDSFWERAEERMLAGDPLDEMNYETRRSVAMGAAARFDDGGLPPEIAKIMDELFGEQEPEGEEQDRTPLSSATPLARARLLTLDEIADAIGELVRL